MLNVKSDQIEAIIADVADTLIVPRFCKLHTHEIHFKCENDPVTIADLEAEAELRKRLMDYLPGSKVVGEEEYALNAKVLDYFGSSDPVWTVDPVDGTKAFLAGQPYFGVIVTLNQNDETLAAWLYDPMSSEFVTAEKGAGAYYKGQRLSVLPAAPLDQLSGVMGARLLDAYAQCTTPPDVATPQFARMLSSCHDYARLVVGVPHFSGRFPQMHFHCWKQTCTPWDNAAGVLINTEAGGFTAHWNEARFHPSHYGRGILTAPDKRSWRELRDWILRFCELPEI